MKISLRTQDGVAVLTGAGEISSHDMEVLRAGILKTLKSGRNRIILELVDAEKLPQELFRELAQFDRLARELSGRIVLAGFNDRLRALVAQASPPPGIECFETTETALQTFHGKAADPVSAPQAAAPEKSKTELRQAELSSTDLKKRVTDLENENRSLLEQLHAASLARWKPSVAAQDAQIEALNGRLEEILVQLKATPGQKAQAKA
jgi:hypothetical protein